MKPVRVILFSVVMIVVAFSFILTIQGQFANEPLHSAMEAVEALSVLLMALFLLHGNEEIDRKLVPPALGFLAMGIINTVHAASWPGDQFVFLRALANLVGGLGFSLSWLPSSRQAVLSGDWAARITASVSLAVCLLVYLFPSALPLMVHDGSFTASAVVINLLAGMLFMIGTAWFTRELSRSGAAEHLMFSLIGLFFGFSGLTFGFSMLWTAGWWFWHALRLSASLLVLSMLVRRHLRTITNLQALLLERKQAENRLKRSYQLTKTIIDSMNDAISLIDTRDFTIISVNSAFLKAYGFADESEIVGKHCYEVTHHRSDVCAAPDDICPLSETVRSGGHFSVDHIHYGREGEKIFAEVSTSPITDENGKVIQVVHVSRDITDRKRAEQDKERLLADIARSNKELEQFAYVASHDLQEPLRMVSSYIGLLERKYKGKLDEKADTYIHFAVDGARRMQKLIEGLLTYSRVASRGRPFVSVDLNRTFEDAVTNLSAAIKDTGARIAKEDLPVVMGDETQMLQLFQNLIGNALKFQNSRVPPEIRIACAKQAKDWTFSIQDNGIGIEQKYFEQVFRIFQRLHSQQEYAGAGIGLAVCKKIVERHGGRIWVESEFGKGTTFLFTIPGTT